jgi:hypothetical protein
MRVLTGAVAAASGFMVIALCHGVCASPTPQGAGTCRTFSAAGTRTLSPGGSASQTCEYLGPTNEYVCTLEVALGSGGFTATTVFTYTSATDFVDEVHVIPPISGAVSGSTT